MQASSITMTCWTSTNLKLVCFIPDSKWHDARSIRVLRSLVGKIHGGSQGVHIVATKRFPIHEKVWKVVKLFKFQSTFCQLPLSAGITKCWGELYRCGWRRNISFMKVLCIKNHYIKLPLAAHPSIPIKSDISSFQCFLQWINFGFFCLCFLNCFFQTSTSRSRS